MTTTQAHEHPADPEAQPGWGGPAEVQRLVDRVDAVLRKRWGGAQDLLNAMCAHALVPSGKLIRPVLLLESALAVGGQIDVVLPAAVGAECGHVASLVHDDIIDDDALRRGRPSVQHRFGIQNAIVAGDALIFDLFLGLSQCREAGAQPDRIVAALEVVARCGIDLCRGQSLEAELQESRSLDIDSYLRMIGWKTAALFRGVCQSGALLAGGSTAAVDALGVYAENLGLAFQIHDDLLPFTAAAAAVGKSDTSDVRNGRGTLPVILGYAAGNPADRRVIDDALHGDGDAHRRRDALHAVLKRTGALAAAAVRARACVDTANAALAELPPTPSRTRLHALAEAAVGRSR